MSTEPITEWRTPRTVLLGRGRVGGGVLEQQGVADARPQEEEAFVGALTGERGHLPVEGNQKQTDVNLFAARCAQRRARVRKK
jgi:hypothetical protein